MPSQNFNSSPNRTMPAEPQIAETDLFSQLKSQLSETNPDLDAVRTLCQTGLLDQVVTALAFSVRKQGRAISDSDARLLAEDVLIERRDEMSAPLLADICKAYRVGGLRNELRQFIEVFFKDGQTSFSDKLDSLELLRQLGLAGVTEHDLVDRLVDQKAEQIGQAGLEARIEFMRALGLCHSSRANLFDAMLADLVDEMPNLSPRNMTRLLMGWNEIRAQNEVALEHALAHASDPLQDYIFRERSLALRCLASLAQPDQAQAAWDNIGHLFDKRCVRTFQVANDLFIALAVAPLVIDDLDQKNKIIRFGGINKAPFIEDDVFRPLLTLTDFCPDSESRVVFGPTWAERVLHVAGRSFALILDDPWQHRMGGYDDGALCGTELARERILRRAGPTVIRVDADLIVKSNISSKLRTFLSGNPAPGIYDIRPSTPGEGGICQIVPR